jgi:hypothetical protein
VLLRTPWTIKEYNYFMDSSLRWSVMKRKYLPHYLFRVFITLLLFLSLPTQAEVNTRLSHNIITQDEPVNLLLEIKGDNDAFPDLSVLDQDFEILGRSQHESVRVINGHRSVTRGVNLTLLPKRLGTLKIPPIPVGKERSSALSLDVVANRVEADEPGEAEAFIRLDLDKNEAFVQQEIILTVRLYLAEGVWGESISEPEPSLPQTQIRLLDEEQYQTQQDGRNYLVIERRYAVHALQTGQLQLGGIRFRGHLGGQGQAPFKRLPGAFQPPGAQQHVVRATSDHVELDILPPPGSFTGKQWLPARNLQLVESGLNSAGHLTAGKPATRHIMLIADGLSAAQLPAIELDLPDGMKQYPERPYDRDQALREGISGSRHLAITLVATEPGRYELPAIEIPWWNTETKRQEIARLPAVGLEVAPGQPGVSPAQPPQPFTSHYAQTEAPFAGLEETWQEEQGSEESKSGSSWLVWFLTTGWLVTLVGWWYSIRRKRPKAPAPVPAPEAVTQQPQNTTADIIEVLASAYRMTNMESARKTWLRWGEQQWPDNPPGNLSRLAERCPPQVASAVLALDKAIYSPAHEFDWVRYSPRELLKKESQGEASSADRQRISA